MHETNNSETRERKKLLHPETLKKSSFIDILHRVLRHISKTQQNSFQQLLNSCSEPLEGNISPPYLRKMTSEFSSETRERKRQIEEIGTFETDPVTWLYKLPKGSYCEAICSHCLCTSKMDLSIAHIFEQCTHFRTSFPREGFGRLAIEMEETRNPQTTHTYDLNPYKGMAQNMERPINQSAPHTHLNVITATENLMQESILRSMNLSVSVLITNCFLGSAK